MAQRLVRQIQIDGNVAYVPLTRGMAATVSLEDLPLVAGRNWCAQRWRDGFYAVSREKGSRKNVLMHRLILGAPAGTEVDHVNRDTLDNRRGNLRPATSTQNKFNQTRRRDNTSGHKGVSFCKQTGMWRATAKGDGRQVSLGRHETVEAAAAAYRSYCVQARGEYARF